LQKWASSRYAVLDKRNLVRSLKHIDNPVLPRGGGGAWDATNASYPRVIKWNGKYYMIYSGNDNVPGHDWDGAQIGLATSEDGKEWTKYAGNPVITLGASGAWDDERVCWTSAPFYYKPNDEFWLYYTGFDGSTYRIGRATSPDMEDWTKDSANNPILDVGSAGAWDDTHVLSPTLVYDGDADGWIMFYVGRDGQWYKIGGATSSDGISWTKFADNPVTIEPPNYYTPERHHRDPIAFMWKSWIILMYSSSARRGGWRSSTAVSKDGHNFSRGRNPLMERDNVAMPRTGYATVGDMAVNAIDHPFIHLEEEKSWLYANFEHAPENYHETGLVYLSPDYFDRILDNVAQYMLDTADQAAWKGESIDADDSAMSPFNLMTYPEVTIEFHTDTAGNLTLEGDLLGDGDFVTLEGFPKSVSADETVDTKVNTDLSFIRISFDTAATVTAKISARRS